MAEVRVEVRVTERDAQRIRIVRHRKELRCRRLCRASEIEEPYMGVVVEFVVEHSLRRPVDDLAVVRIMSGSLIVCIGRIDRSTKLGAEPLLLIAEVKSGTLSDRTVQDLIGVPWIWSLAVFDVVQKTVCHQIISAIVGVLVRSVPAPVVRIVRLQEKVLCQWFRIDNPSVEG